MKIEKQDIISWLLDKETIIGNYDIGCRLTEVKDINEFLALAM